MVRRFCARPLARINLDGPLATKSLSASQRCASSGSKKAPRSELRNVPSSTATLPIAPYVPEDHRRPRRCTGILPGHRDRTAQASDCYISFGQQSQSPNMGAPSERGRRYPFQKTIWNSHSNIYHHDRFQDRYCYRNAFFLPASTKSPYQCLRHASGGCGDRSSHNPTVLDDENRHRDDACARPCQSHAWDRANFG